MSPIVIATPALTFAEYRKLCLRDFRTRHPFYYIGLPLFSLLLLTIFALVVSSTGVAALEWHDVRMPVLWLGATVAVWVGT